MKALGILTGIATGYTIAALYALWLADRRWYD